MTVRYDLRLTPGDDAEIIAARLWAAGALGVQELPDALIAWFDGRVEDAPPGGEWSQEPDADWLAAWREGIGPVRAGRILVVPSWLAADTPHAPGDVRIELDPGVAFGSGHHATTRLCLEVLQDVMAPGDRVVDVGCGTGILAIAAALLGAGEVEGVDVDGDAVHATRRNAAANGVDLTAHLGGPDAVPEPADLVLANLLTPTLHELARSLVGLVRPNGHLVASGVATERADRVVEALAAEGSTLVRREDAEGWAVLVMEAAA